MSSRGPILSDEMWARIEPLMPPEKGAMGPPWAPHRQVVEGAVYRLRAGIGWRDLPREFGAFSTVHRRFKAWCEDGTWDRILAVLIADADAAGGVDWRVSVDSTTARVHQHAAGARRSSARPFSHTGGGTESQVR
jgi:transposase